MQVDKSIYMHFTSLDQPLKVLCRTSHIQHVWPYLLSVACYVQIQCQGWVAGMIILKTVFSVLPKETSACGSEKSGIKLKLENGLQICIIGS